MPTYVHTSFRKREPNGHAEHAKLRVTKNTTKAGKHRNQQRRLQQKAASITKTAEFTYYIKSNQNINAFNTQHMMRRRIYRYDTTDIILYHDCFYYYCIIVIMGIYYGHVNMQTCKHVCRDVSVIRTGLRTYSYGVFFCISNIWFVRILGYI